MIVYKIGEKNQFQSCVTKYINKVSTLGWCFLLMALTIVAYANSLLGYKCGDRSILSKSMHQAGAVWQTNNHVSNLYDR
jgi:hypothetical protein